MIYKYDGFPLYEEEDRDLAIDAIYDYLIGNNKPDQKFLYSESFDLMEMMDPSIVKESIIRSYGVNIHTMANFLSVQNAYFSKYMDSIIKYLKYCGQDAYITTIKPALITPFSIIKLFKSGKLNTVIPYWDPNTKWKNFEFTDNYAINIINPINIFYISDLVIKHADREFVEYLSRNTGLNNLLENRSFPSDFSMRLLPSCNPCALIEVVKLIHNYF